MSEYCDHFDVLFSDLDDHFIGFRESQTGGGGGVGAGYYVPAVSESGILSWTPSDPSMPDVTPRNVKGQAGDPGADGVSPELTVETISGGHRVTIIDADHPEGQSFDVMDGEGAVSSVNGLSGAVVLGAEDVGALPNDTTIPTELSQLSDDATHRTVTDTEKATWNAKQDAIGYTPANDSEVVKNTPVVVSNLNSATTPGFYRYIGSATNTPDARGGMLVVLKHDTWLAQIAISASVAFSASNFFVYVREYTGSAWTLWVQFQSFDNSVTDVKLNGTSIVSGGIANILLSTIFAPTRITNLNDATDTGFYDYNGGSANAPNTQGGVLIVLKHGSSIAQIAISIGTTAYTGFIRTSLGTTWLEWTSFVSLS